MFIQIVFMFLLGVVCTPFTNAQPSFEAFLRSMGHGGGGMQFPSRPSFPEMIDMTSSAGSGSCPYQSHPNKLKFNQMVNNRMITQDCAPGTMFDLSKCSCVNAPSAAPGGGPPVGGDPRMSATGDPNFSQMMSMLQSLGGGSGTPFPSSMDIQPPQMSVPFNPMQMPGLAMPRARTQSSISPPAASSVGGPDMAALMSLLGGGGSSSPNGGGNDMFNALMAGSSGGMPGAFPGGPMNLPGVTGTMAGPAPIDMTSFFNEQGQMGAGGGLAGLANINYVRMQDLDRRGVIDLSDLTPAGLAAANAHFSG